MYRVILELLMLGAKNFTKFQKDIGNVNPDKIFVEHNFSNFFFKK